jgi:hypothetical protein
MRLGGRVGAILTALHVVIPVFTPVSSPKVGTATYCVTKPPCDGNFPAYLVKMPFCAQLSYTVQLGGPGDAFNADLPKPTDLDELIHVLASSAVSHGQADAASTNARPAAAS